MSKNDDNGRQFKVRGISKDAVDNFSEAELLVLHLQAAIQERVPRSVLIKDQEMAELLTLVTRYFEQYHADVIQQMDPDSDEAQTGGDRLQNTITKAAKANLCDRPDCESCAFMRRTFRKITDVDLPWHPQDELAVDELSGDELAQAKAEANAHVQDALKKAQQGNGGGGTTH